jgi:FkbM family methyltransferase
MLEGTISFYEASSQHDLGVQRGMQEYQSTGSCSMNSDCEAECRRWRDWILARMFQLMHNVEKNNFDSVRYRGIDAHDFRFQDHASYLGFLIDNVHDFHRARSLLADDCSKDLYDLLILFRLLGHLHVRLPFNNEHTQDQLHQVEKWKIEDTTDSGLSIFSVPLGDRNIKIKGWPENAVATFLFNQYYLIRDKVVIAPRPGDHVIDAGACFGDTGLRFAHEVGESGHVYSFDPVGKHCEIMRESFAMNPNLESRISAYAFGVSNRNHIPARSLDAGSTINPAAKAFHSSIPTRTIDSLVDEGAVARVDFLKMDVEGSELRALQGAEMTLRRWKPRLAISLYHEFEDFFTIPLWLNDLNVGYRFLLDHYSIHHEETVLYAIASEQ